MEGKDLEFAVNGERFKVNFVDPCTTLLEFLRFNTPFKSVKLGCGEGNLSLSSLFFFFSSRENLLFHQTPLKGVPLCLETICMCSLESRVICTFLFTGISEIEEHGETQI